MASLATLSVSWVIPERRGTTAAICESASASLCAVKSGTDVRDCGLDAFFVPNWVERVETDDCNNEIGVQQEGGKTSGARHYSANQMLNGAAVVQWLGRSPPTSAIRVRYPVGSLLDLWGSCRTMQLAGGFSRNSPVSSTLIFQRHPILGSHFTSCLGMTGTYGSQLESPSLGECSFVLGSLPTRRRMHDVITGSGNVPVQSSKYPTRCDETLPPVQATKTQFTLLSSKRPTWMPGRLQQRLKLREYDFVSGMYEIPEQAEHRETSTLCGQPGKSKYDRSRSPKFVKRNMKHVWRKIRISPFVMLDEENFMVMGSNLLPALRCSILSSLTLIGSQDHAVKSRAGPSIIISGRYEESSIRIVPAGKLNSRLDITDKYCTYQLDGDPSLGSEVAPRKEIYRCSMVMLGGMEVSNVRLVEAERDGNSLQGAVMVEWWKGEKYVLVSRQK
ncbi:hypothetical protein PR048_006610 [Dryococelus australis]|uniref:Uncharacterized protein n=1 Tax=Dryococelus australis TaxID=614101 RepID=A0ABQ9IBF3_9NEOP|nr:hypothetical protein PR048_006610 [Dryococelus australis]